MKQKNLELKNNFQLKIPEGKILKGFSKEYSNLFLKLNMELKDQSKTLNVLDKKFSFNFKYSELRKFKKFKKVAIVGMGGSILGSEAIYNFLEEKIKKKFYFFNDIDEKKILNFKKKEKFSKILFIIISKSGNTIETLSNIFSLGIIKKNSKNIIIISEKRDNFLFNLSKQYNLFYIEHKNSIGGRYSVLSETGIIPSFLMGVNTKRLRSNLLMILKGNNKKFFKRSVISLTKILSSTRYNNLIFLNYSPELEKFLFWLQQLVAESLGKKNKGFLPLISNAPKDHHSLLQLYLDGPKDKIFYIFSAENKSKVKININRNIKGKDFLKNKFLQTVKNAQKKALIQTLVTKKIPFRLFNIKRIDESVLGSLFSYFILETILVGKLLKINPYDQPAVEQVKKYTKKLLIK